MNLQEPSAAMAFGLGLWTAVQPCPMTANLAAVSYLGRRAGSPVNALFAALLYAAGQMIAYVGLAWLVLEGIASRWRLSEFLQQHVNQILGPVWILTAMVLLELIRFRLPGVGVGAKWQSKINAWGTWNALPLGVMLALGFCPVSAAIFFVDVLAIAAGGGSHLVYPAIYALRRGAARARICRSAGRRLALAGFGPESYPASARLAEPSGRRSAAGRRHLRCAEVQLRGLAVLTNTAYNCGIP